MEFEKRKEVAKPNKLCPFCTGLGKPVFDKDDDEKEICMIRCVMCNAIGGWAFDEKGAWGWWNMRG